LRNGDLNFLFFHFFISIERKPPEMESSMLTSAGIFARALQVALHERLWEIFGKLDPTTDLGGWLLYKEIEEEHKRKELDREEEEWYERTYQRLLRDVLSTIKYGWNEPEEGAIKIGRQYVPEGCGIKIGQKPKHENQPEKRRCDCGIKIGRQHVPEDCGIKFNWDDSPKVKPVVPRIKIGREHVPEDCGTEGA
jgi:hypothetical protein